MQLSLAPTGADAKTIQLERVENIRRQHPQLFRRPSVASGCLTIRSEPLASLFPSGGLPFGHLFDITGGRSCGKTSLLLFLLSGVPSPHRMVYIDASGSFFPAAAHKAGLPLERFGVIAAADEQAAVLTAENVIQAAAARVVACDLSGRTRAIPAGLLHRLRTAALKAQVLLLFLTESDTHVIPPSLMSAQLTVERLDRTTLGVTVSKSRMMPVGRQVEVMLR